jgi:uncharacterized membrane protein YukC
MSTQSGNTARGTGRAAGVPPVVAAALVVVLVAFIGWLAYAYMLAPPKPAPMDAKGQANHDFIKQLAVKSGGDMSKLSPEEQQKLQKMTTGYGAMAMKNVLKEH